MCNFFSLCSAGDGKPLYFDATIRKKILAKELNYGLDSHTSIADYFGYKSEAEDKLNKYEYNPLTVNFKIGHRGTTDDSIQIENFCKRLDFKTVVPELILKQIVNPFIDKQTVVVTSDDIILLKDWASVWVSVMASVWDSVRASVMASVGASVMASVRTSVMDSVRTSVIASVWASVIASVRTSVIASVRTSVMASVWDSVGDSVGASAWAYIATFFNIKYQYDFSSCQKLWERGLVPSFDGATWRLHGHQGKELYKIDKAALVATDERMDL